MNHFCQALFGGGGVGIGDGVGKVEPLSENSLNSFRCIMEDCPKIHGGMIFWGLKKWCSRYPWMLVFAIICRYDIVYVYIYIYGLYDMSVPDEYQMNQQHLPLTLSNVLISKLAPLIRVLTLVLP